MTSFEAEVGEGGRTVIPRPLRERLGIEPGDTVRFYLEGERIVLDPRGNDGVLEDLLEAAEKEPEPDSLDLDGCTERRFRE